MDEQKKILSASKAMELFPVWIKMICDLASTVLDGSEQELANPLNQLCGMIVKHKPTFTQHRQVFVDAADCKLVTFGGREYPSAHVASFEIAEEFIEEIWLATIGPITREDAKSVKHLSNYFEKQDWKAKLNSLTGSDPKKVPFLSESLADSLVLVSSAIKKFASGRLGSSSRLIETTRFLTVRIESERAMLSRLTAEMDGQEGDNSVDNDSQSKSKNVESAVESADRKCSPKEVRKTRKEPWNEEAEKCAKAFKVAYDSPHDRQTLRAFCRDYTIINEVKHSHSTLYKKLTQHRDKWDPNPRKYFR